MINLHNRNFIAAQQHQMFTGDLSFPAAFIIPAQHY